TLVVVAGRTRVIEPEVTPPLPITGIWRGTVVQKDPDARYPVEMEVKAPEGGSIRYPTLRCGGTGQVSKVDGNPPVLPYREHIAYGNCVDGGTIHVYVGGDRIGWRWTGPGPTVYGTLTRENTLAGEHRSRQVRTDPHRQHEVDSASESAGDRSMLGGWEGT